jgi:hypothetical protein
MHLADSLAARTAANAGCEGAACNLKRPARRPKIGNLRGAALALPVKVTQITFAESNPAISSKPPNANQA